MRAAFFYLLAGVSQDKTEYQPPPLAPERIVSELRQPIVVPSDRDDPLPLDIVPAIIPFAALEQIRPRRLVDHSDFLTPGL